MSKVRRKTSPPHFVLVDTSTLWHEDKQNVVNPEFQEFWGAHAAEFGLLLIVPEMVRGELLYQQTTSSIKTLERIKKSFDSLSDVAGVAYKHKVTEVRVCRDVERRLDKCLSQLNAVVEPTPVDTIDWKRVVSDAVWREPPFLEEKDREKGFRDCLILETVQYFCNENKNAEIVFVSQDRVLREAAQIRLATRHTFSIYETPAEFSSYLNLTKEKLNEDFIRAIQHKAREKFFSPDNPECLYRRAKILKQIRERFPYQFSPPVDSFGFGIGEGLLSPVEVSRQKAWSFANDERIFVQAPQFEKLDKECEFYWKSNISFVQLFKYKPAVPGVSFQFGEPLERKLRVLKFAVTWKASVGKDGRFRNLEFIDTVLDSHTFDRPTSDQLRNYRIEEGEE